MRTVNIDILYSSEIRDTMLLNMHVSLRNTPIFICGVYTFGSNDLLQFKFLGGMDLGCASGIIWHATFHSFISQLLSTCHVTGTGLDAGGYDSE